MIIRCPEFIKREHKSNALVSTIDIFPTILEALGYPIPKGVQGKSLMPIFAQEQTSVRQYLFTEFNYHQNTIDGFYPRRSIRDDRYKLILNLASGRILNGLIGIDGDKAYTYSQDLKYKNTWVREVFDRFRSPPEIEFYDLQNDPFEKNNLEYNVAHASKIAELSNELYKWMASTNDPFLSKENVDEEIRRLNSLSDNR